MLINSEICVLKETFKWLDWQIIKHERRRRKKKS